MRFFLISLALVGLFCIKSYITVSVADSLLLSGTLPLTAFPCVKACQNQCNADTYSVFSYNVDTFPTCYPNEKVLLAEARNAGQLKPK